MAHPSRISSQSVLQAAIEIIEKDGVTAFGMRPVAERLRVRAPSLYKHCGGLEELRAQVSAHAVRELAARLELGVGRVAGGSGSARLAALMWSYVLWSEENPGLYDLIVADSQPPASEASSALWEVILRETERMTGRAPDLEGALAVWAFLHGHVLLTRTIPAGSLQAPDVMERGMVALLKGL